MKTYYYKTYEDDIIKSKNQEYKIDNNYKYERNKILSNIIYFIVKIISFIYSKLILRVKIIKNKEIKNYKKYFIYSNHTLTLADVLNPFLYNKKPSIICSSSNLGIPILGKIIPYANGLPIPNDIHKLIEFNNLIKTKNSPIIIYPEAHLWPYYTKIRKFNTSSFFYPVDSNSPIFISTTTFQKRKYSKKPKITIYVDGPYFIDNNKSRKENIKYLNDITYNQMVKRSKNSTYEYIKYKKI